jgi:hypothetical protein
MTKARHTDANAEWLSPLDLVLTRFEMNQIELAEALEKDRSLPSHWRNRYNGNIPASAWDGIMTYAENNQKRISLEELRSGGVA